MGGIGDRACGRDVVDVAGISSSERKARTRGRVAIDIRDRGSGVWQGALVAAGISGSEGKRQACGERVANHTGQVSRWHGRVAKAHMWQRASRAVSASGRRGADSVASVWQVTGDVWQ